MPAQRPQGPSRGVLPRLDRFATHRAFITNCLSGIVGGPSGSPSTAVVWFVLWDMANGRDGSIRGATILGLSKRTGLDRVTVRKALDALVEMKAITKQPGLGNYHMAHTLKDE